MFFKVFEGGVYKYASVKSWTEKALRKNACETIFQCDQALFPCNIRKNHWILVVVDMTKKNICSYDSFGSDGYDFMRGLRNYLKDDVCTSSTQAISCRMNTL